MNVNSNNNKRIRRSPEEAKALILGVAAERLAKMGLDGLNISGVAKAAGMSHATVIHHFGSTAAMREALLAEMTRELLADVISALDHHESTELVLDRLFKTLSQDGHGKLLAWLSLEAPVAFRPEGGTVGLFSNIIDTIAEESGDRSHAKHLVYLVAVAAMGLSICGDSLAQLVDLDKEERQTFPGWLAAHIQTL